MRATVLRQVPHGVHVAHPHADGTTGTCLVWNILGDGQVALECDCGLSPVELAVAIGIPLSRLLPVERDISRTMLEERLDGDGSADRDTRALLAALDAQPERRTRS